LLSRSGVKTLIIKISKNESGNTKRLFAAKEHQGRLLYQKTEAGSRTTKRFISWSGLSVAHWHNNSYAGASSSARGLSSRVAHVDERGSLLFSQSRLIWRIHTACYWDPLAIKAPVPAGRCRWFMIHGSNKALREMATYHEIEQSNSDEGISDDDFFRISLVCFLVARISANAASTITFLIMRVTKT